MTTMQATRGNSQATSRAQRLTLQAMAAEYVERIGARIRERREDQDLTRRQLVAKMAGVVSENDIYRWERGQHRPHDDKLQALADALDVDVAYFLAPMPEEGTGDLMEAFASAGDDDGESRTQLDRIEAKLDDIVRRLDALDADAIERDEVTASLLAALRAAESGGSGRGRRGSTR